MLNRRRADPEGVAIDGIPPHCAESFLGLPFARWMEGGIPLAVAAALGLSLSACSDVGGGNPDAGVAGGIDVHGKVVGPGGIPSASTVVRIKSGAFSAGTVTDSSGAFSFKNVPTPYDATVVAPFITTPPTAATVTLGLTSATPTLLDFDGQTPPGGGSASLSGSVTGGAGFPSPEGYLTSVVFASPEVQTDRYLVADNETGAYTTDRFDDSYDAPERVPLSWSGPGTTVGTVHALQWKQSDPAAFSGPYTLRIPAAYSGYGSKADLSLGDGSTLTGQDIPLTPVAAATLAGTYSPPAGFGDDRYTLVALRFARGGLMVIVADFPLDDAFSYLTPDIPGATLVLATTGSKGTAFSTSYQPGLAANTTRLVTNSPAPSELSAPLDNAGDVGPGTQFAWTPAPNGVSLLRVGSAEPGAPSVVIVTSGNSANLPDLSSVGITFPRSTSFQWTVYGVGPYASVEAASVGLTAEHPWPLLATGGDLLDARSPGFVTGSSARVFTTR